MSGTPTQAQDGALTGLVTAGVISAEQAAAVRAAVWPAEATGAGRVHWVVELAGYLGGGLMIGGVALVLNARWAELSIAAKTSMLGGFAVVLIVAAVLIAGGPAGIRRLARGPSNPRRRVVGALLALVSVPTAFAVAALNPDTRTDTWGAVIGFVVSVVAVAVLSTPIGVLIAGGMSVAALTALIGELQEPSALTVGLLVLGLGVAWLVVTLVGMVRPRPLGLVIGGALAIVGAQLPLDGGTEVWAYVLTTLVAIACFALYQVVRDLVLLIGGVVAVTLVVPEFVNDISGGAVEGAMIMLVAGATLILASGIGLWLRRADPEDSSRSA
jgi:hypothetical protein